MLGNYSPFQAVTRKRDIYNQMSKEIEIMSKKNLTKMLKTRLFNINKNVNTYLISIDFYEMTFNKVYINNSLLVKFCCVTYG